MDLVCHWVLQGERLGVPTQPWTSSLVQPLLPIFVFPYFYASLVVHAIQLSETAHENDCLFFLLSRIGTLMECHTSPSHRFLAHVRCTWWFSSFSPKGDRLTYLFTYMSRLSRFLNLAHGMGVVHHWLAIISPGSRRCKPQRREQR